MFESLNKKFEVEDAEVVPEESTSTELEVIVVGERSAVEEDTDLARSTLRELLRKGGAAVDQALYIAENTEHPRAYEVAGAFIKQISEVARDLMEIQKAKKVIDKPVDGIKPQNVKTQNIFVGSTKDLLKKIREEGAMTATAKVVEP